MSAYRYPKPHAGPSGERIVAWLVIALLFACAALALYDAYLLLAGLQSG
jgi:hypothetical protein